MIVSEIALYEMLKSKIGEQEAAAFVTVLENRVDRKMEEYKSVLSTKTDLANTRADLIKWMFIFWMGQISVIVGLLVFFFRSIPH